MSVPNQANTSNQVVSHAIKGIIDKFSHQLKAKEAVKFLPQYIKRQFVAENKNILYLSKVPRPNKRIQDYPVEDAMVIEPGIEGLVTSQMPVVRRKDLQLLRTASAYDSSKRNVSSRYPSTGEIQNTRKKVRRQMSQNINQKPIELPDRVAQSTAKSYRSVRQLETQIGRLRSSYLSNLRKEAKERMSMTQQLPPAVKKRIPRQFTFDINGEILEKHQHFIINTVASPLKSKAVSAPKIMNKNKKTTNKSSQEQDNIEEMLNRADTKSGERKKRQFSNQNKRQVSHIPFISLTDNSKIIENINILQGPSTNRSISFRSTFNHHYRNPAKDVQGTLMIDGGEDSISLPKTFRQKGGLNKQGSILKNSRFEKNKLDSSRSIDFNPVNVTREHGIDQYYRLNVPLIQ